MKYSSLVLFRGCIGSMLRSGRTALVLLLVLQFSMSYAQSYNSISSGIWNNGSNWDIGLAPSHDNTTNGDVIVISSSIFLNGNLTIVAGTTLIIEACDTLQVSGNVQFNNNSTIVVQSCAFLIVEGSVANNNNSNDITINGTIQIAGNYTGGNGSELNGVGNMDVEGSVTTNGSGTVYGSTEDCLEDCDNSGLSPLPVELIEFTGEVREDHIEISWSTASETNSDYYILQKSTDAVNFQDYRQVKGSESTTELSSYFILDDSPSPGINYYRLLQFDFDGQYATKGTIAVEFKYDELIIYPNPLTKGAPFNVKFYNNRSDRIKINLISMDGRTIFSNIVNAVEGSNLVKLNVGSNLNPGIYVILVELDGLLKTKKLLVY